MIKRAFDIAAGAAGLLLLLPVLLAVALLVAMLLGWPVLFSQVRPGRGGRPFRMVKFRTMTSACDADGKLLPDAERITRFGRFLRASSLDELPELWNVLRGDMSLVGPRPLLVEYLPLYSPQQARRHEVRPGITGWAQVNGRNAISWDEKFALDVWYVDHQGFLLDMKIIFLTVWRVFRRDGISAAGEATMPKFTGARHHEQG
jgi:lipopolysaccharide/colanic/teichoic acid biosynthesis glycosyltransferase